MKLPAWLLKKGVKIPLIIIVSILLLLVLLNFIAPPIVHSYAEKHSKELCHRTVTLDKLRMNIFTGMVRIEGFNALEENDKDSFITFDKLEVRINLWRLLAKEVRLTKIELVNPDIIVAQNGSDFNFTDIIEFYTDDDDDEDTTKSEWSVDLRNITLVKGNIVYKDLQRSSKFDLCDLSLLVPRLYFSGHSSDIGVDFKLADGGAVAFKMLYDLEKNNYHLHINLSKFAIEALTPYVKEALNVSGVQGALSADLALVGNLDHVLEIVADGSVSLQDLKLSMADNMRPLQMDNLQIDIEKIDLKNNLYHFKNITFTRPQIDYHLYQETNTLAQLLKTETASEQESTQPEAEPAKETSSASTPVMDLRVQSLCMEDASVVLNDHTLEQTFALPITNLKIKADNLSLKNEFVASLNAVVGNGGELTCRWKGTLNGFENHSFVIKLQNFKMSDISPYCVHYTAYPISSGVMNFNSRDIIKNNILTSQNGVDIYNCKADKKLKDMDPEYKIPVRAALYILTDRKGKITMNLPLKGDVKSPEFSLKKLIWKTIGNFLAKVVMAPADFIASAFKGHNDVFADVQMALTDRNISSELYDKLNAMSEVVKEKGEMQLTVQQKFSREECAQVVANWLKTEDQTTIEEGVQRSIEERNRMFLEYFKVQGIAEDRIKFLEPADENVKKGKVNLSFKLVMPGESDMDFDFMDE